ncbi:sorbosone dehydrogenase family protein [Photobacterium sp. OFAV2-7]|uniref:PQQ-dependent sugar dehydrogenase n=1 Tax=Photobacterium sp. OFAV2-7 TaxID=2917748 RepID=UPI001EF57CE4|nr:PQQ-dependent sugar dehydrogenase [Photobacterium sp. OFAV2-7]MCG7585048.1 PQQ-dependent sugar dehydrogenase [Photobacterium sp. OFAV2-7]
MNRWDLRLITFGLFSLLLIACRDGSESSAPISAPPAIALKPAFNGLSFQQPVLLLQAPNQRGRWYLLERAGRVLQFSDTVSPNVEVMLDLTSLVDTTGEGGLLGMAFHPQFFINGQIYLSYTAAPVNSGAALESRLSRFISNDGGLTLDPASEMVLLRLNQPFDNHNGGHIAFGADGMLYFGLGDGGSAGDLLGHGQNTNSLFGSILRLDVDGGVPYAIPMDNPFSSGGGRGEIYAWGLRNPWRWSFDRSNGDLWLGDVGQSSVEEINLIVTGGNYGWNIREGAQCFSDPNCPSTGLIAPEIEYPHPEGRSVTGGFVYRGASITNLDGFYLYGDFITGRIWAFNPLTGATTILLDTEMLIVSFAEDLDGELLVLDFLTGNLFRIVPS